MKKIFVCLAICLSCVACGSNETDEPKAVSKYSIEELVERQNTLKKLTKESLSSTSSEWLVSNEDPIIALALEDQASVTVKVITSQIIPRVADDICEPVIATMKDMEYEQYKITIWHSSNLANEAASGASWETKDGVTGRFVDNERETVVFQSGVSIDDLYSYYDNFGLENKEITNSIETAPISKQEESSIEQEFSDTMETETISENTISLSENNESSTELDIEKCINDFLSQYQLESDYSFVQEHSILFDGSNIMFVIVVDDNTDTEKALNFGDTFVKQLNTYANTLDSNVALSHDDYYGGLYENYNALVGIAETGKRDNPDNWLAYYCIIQGNIKMNM